MNMLSDADPRIPFLFHDMYEASCCCRGGPLSADHVNILANVDMLSDVLAIAAGRGADVEDRFLSDVRSVAARMAVSE